MTQALGWSDTYGEHPLNISHPETALRKSERNGLAKPAFRKIGTTDAHKCDRNLPTPSLPCAVIVHGLGLAALRAGQMAKRLSFATLCHIKGRTRLSSRFQDAEPSVSLGGKNR